ncbi:DUF4190 domain-containing protein [Kitasatospora sp. NBC_01302]|uniref:DUF4190 domain-containing protein n=1 Tax=Kitasatospora sp. NBC_01302 TaxID=2903575 RepID=UPI002E0E153D|nr:DUF4190 domain-containing protein [Kitasatospora sp. NBC_01302]
MTDAAGPDGGEAVRPQDAVSPGAGAGDPWAPPQDAVPAGYAGPPPGSGPYQYPYPYPYGQAGPYPVPSDGRRVVEGTNGLAITALVTGVTCCLWPAALGFGIGALIQLRHRRQRGLGIAVAGVMLGVLGLVMGVFGAILGQWHFAVGGANTSGTSVSDSPLPAPSSSPAPPTPVLTQAQRDFLTDTAEIKAQDRILKMPETDPGMAVQESGWTAQALADSAAMLGRTQWPAEVKDQMAVLVSAFRADQAVWNAAATNTTDPVGAYQAALRTNAPSTAEAAARKALGLTDDDRPVDPGTTATPPAPDGTPPDAPPAPPAV